jgi:O-methyltransferase
MLSRTRTIPARVMRRVNLAGEEIASFLSPKRRAVKVAASVSLCQRDRLVGLQGVADRVLQDGIRGDVVECGVFQGGSALVIAERLLRAPSDRRMWLFDVFSGMPEPGPEDPPDAWDDVGKFVSSPEIVRGSFAAAGLSSEAVSIVQGRYEDTLPGFEVPREISFLHLDCDWYDSLKLCLHTFYDAVAPGGAIVFDDYGHWSGCRKAVDEFFAERGERPTLTAIDYTSHYLFKQ